MKKHLALFLALVLCLGTFSFQLTSVGAAGDNLLAGLSYTYTFGSMGFWSPCEDNNCTILTDGSYRGDGNTSFNGNSGVVGTTIDIAGTDAQNKVEFAFYDVTSIGTIVIRSARAYFQNQSVNRHCTVAAVKVTKDGLNYTDVEFTTEYIAVTDAPKYAIEQNGEEYDQYFDITVSVEGATNIMGLEITLTNDRPDGSNAFMVQLDEIEAYAPGVNPPVRGEYNNNDSSDDVTSEESSDDIVIAETTYTVTITDNGDGTATVVATLPADIYSGKIVVSVSDKLTLIPGSLKAGITGSILNENYNRNGVVGAAVSFASINSYSQDSVVFEAKYTIKNDATITADDVTVPEWSLSNYDVKLATETDGDVKKIFVPFGDDDNSSEVEADITYTLTVAENTDGTVTIKAAVPASIDSGKIVVDVSDKLTLVPGSLKASVDGYIPNESYNRDGVEGACISFATISAIPEGTIAFEATYTVESDKHVSLDDVTVPLWNVGYNKMRVSSEADGNVKKVLVHNLASEWKHNDEKHWHECTVCGFIADEEHHDYDAEEWFRDDDFHWHICDVCETMVGREAHTFVYGVCECGAEEYEKGDVNKDGYVDNLDGAMVLKYDAGILDEIAINGDVNGDGWVDNVDASIILKYDAGILDQI